MGMNMMMPMFMMTQMFMNQAQTMFQSMMQQRKSVEQASTSGASKGDGQPAGKSFFKFSIITFTKLSMFRSARRRHGSHEECFANADAAAAGSFLLEIGC